MQRLEDKEPEMWLFGRRWRFPSEADAELIAARERFIEDFPLNPLVPVYRKDIAFLRWINGELTRAQAEASIAE